MKKFFRIWILYLVFVASAQAQQSDFIPGNSLIFEDRFELDPKGDFPVKWSTSGDGEIVVLDNANGKWLRISQPTSVSPELKNALPENCTIEFDLYLKNVAGAAPAVKFGLTTLSDVAIGDVYKKSIYVQLQGYNEAGTIVFGKSAQDLGTKSFATAGYIGRSLHVSIAVNNTRFRVYLGQQKVLDMPKLLTPDYRNNFFVASSALTPASEEGVYISNIRIAAGDEDARSVLRKQLMKRETTVAIDTMPGNQTNEIVKVTQPATYQQGQAFQQNSVIAAALDTLKKTARFQDTISVVQNSISLAKDSIVFVKDSVSPVQNMVVAGVPDSSLAIPKQGLELIEDKIKASINNKLNEKKEEIISDIKSKATKAIEKSKTLNKAKKFLSGLTNF